MVYLCIALNKAPIDILFIDDKKFDNFFSGSQFKIDGYPFLPLGEIGLIEEETKYHFF